MVTPIRMRGEQRDARAARYRKRRIFEAQCLRGILRLCRPDQHHQSAQQDAERDGGENGGQHHLAGHLAHQEQIDHHADGETEHDRGRDRGHRRARKHPGRGQQQIRPDHHQFAMRKIKHAADAIDQDITAGDQCVDRRQDDDIDEELQGRAFKLAVFLVEAILSPLVPAKAGTQCRISKSLFVALGPRFRGGERSV